MAGDFYTAEPGDVLDVPSENAGEDGRDREWEDRARVNLEKTPDGVHTSVERDFEPENPEKDEPKKKDDRNY